MSVVDEPNKIGARRVTVNLHPIAWGGGDSAFCSFLVKLHIRMVCVEILTAPTTR